MTLRFIFIISLIFLASLPSISHANSVRQVAIDPPDKDSPLPTFVPCAPTDPSFSSTVTKTDSCKHGRKGRLLTAQINNGCVFVTAVIRYCRKTNVRKLVKNARACIASKAMLCDDEDTFLDCTENAVRTCKGKVVSLGAVA